MRCTGCTCTLERLSPGGGNSTVPLNAGPGVVQREQQLCLVFFFFKEQLCLVNGELVRSLVAHPSGGEEERAVCRSGEGHALKSSPVTLGQGTRTGT